MHLGALMLAKDTVALHSCLTASVAVADALKRAAVSRLGESIPRWLDGYRIREVAVLMNQICTLSPRLRASLPKGNGPDICRAGVADVDCIEGTRHQVGPLGEKSGKSLPCPCNPAAVGMAETRDFS